MSSVLTGIDQAEGLRRMMSSFEESRTRIISVTSGKGGVGKSNFTLNLGIVLANLKENSKKIVVMDADLGLANINILLSIITKYNLSHVIKGQKTLMDIIQRTEYGIDIIGGASGITQIANLNEEQIENLISAMKDISYADFLLIDTSAGISSNVTSFLSASNEVIVVTTPEPTAITDAYGVIKAIVSETDNPNIKIVINRARTPVEATKVSQKIIDIGAHFLNIKIEYLGFIYEDPSVQEAVRRQIPFTRFDPNSKASICMDHIAKRLLNLKVPEENSWTKFLRLFSK